MSDVSVRVAWADDAAAIAAVQVAAWRTAYADVLPAEQLAGLDPDRFAAAWHESLARLPGTRAEGRAGLGSQFHIPRANRG